MANKNNMLNAARIRRKDDFYTYLADIEKELRYYRPHFKDKVVLCNCDDPRSSNFFRYFTMNFELLGLRKVIATCYKNQDVDLFSQGTAEKALYQIYEGDKNGNRKVDDEEIEVKYLDGDGDFRSKECVELLKQSDIVVTNPPFSLFREFICLLAKYEKKFLIIGNVNAVTYKEVFPLIMRNELWLGASIHSGDRKFGVPDDYPLDATTCGIDEDGRRYINVKGVRWFTNLDYPQRHTDIPLYKKYTPEEFPTYDNYAAIEVGKTSDIPCDYDDIMGVPITFLDKYNPQQFEMIGCSDNGAIADQYKLPHFKRHNEPYLKGTKVYKRIFIRRRNNED